MGAMAWLLWGWWAENQNGQRWQHWKNSSGTTVDGRYPKANHLGCDRNPINNGINMDKSPTSTGERRISALLSVPKSAWQGPVRRTCFPFISSWSHAWQLPTWTYSHLVHLAKEPHEVGFLGRLLWMVDEDSGYSIQTPTNGSPRKLL